jgi:ribonucleotide monophosphatase NagD (HAD superfamily)
MTKIIESIGDIISLYDVFILDQWGVMHDGYKGYDHAINSVEKLIRENKKLIIISNSSKRKTSSISRLKSLGFDKNHFIEVMTSGEMIWQEIFTSIDNYGNDIKNCFHIYNSSKRRWFRI